MLISLVDFLQKKKKSALCPNVLSVLNCLIKSPESAKASLAVSRGFYLLLFFPLQPVKWTATKKESRCGCVCILIPGSREEGRGQWMDSGVLAGMGGSPDTGRKQPCGTKRHSA